VVAALCAGLFKVDHQVITATNGEEALKKVRLSIKELAKVEFLVTDFIMPGMDGLGLVRSARELLPNLPAIIMSGYSEAEFWDEANRLPNCRCLQKPFRLAEIVNIIAELKPV
jgi:two-component system, cell cycle sensor histidine kinase and response regulator CckA